MCGRTLSLEVDRVGFRTCGSVLVRYGDTVVLGTAMVGKKPFRHGLFPAKHRLRRKIVCRRQDQRQPLYQARRPPIDDAILIGRLIDRPIRPLWPKGYRHEVQGVATVLSMDPDFRPDMIAMIAMSAAFMLTGAPFDGPVAGVRVGMVDGKFTAFATPEELDDGELDLVVAGTKDGIMMVEAGANEVTEEQVVEAIAFAFEAMQPAIKLQQELVEKVGVTKQEYELELA